MTFEKPFSSQKTDHKAEMENLIKKEVRSFKKGVITEELTK